MRVLLLVLLTFPRLLFGEMISLPTPGPAW
jgi:hypothetical protein